jgi:predicted transcriptional regulator
MMIQDRWWKEFLRRQKEGNKTHAYILRGAAPPKTAQRILFYVTKPVANLAGHADYIERKVGTPETLWQENGEESVLSSKAKYDNFIEGSDRVSFVRFKNLQEAVRPVPLNEVLMFFGVRRLSRKGFYMDKDTGDRLVALMSQA